MLDFNNYLQVIESTPLVSIDLIIEVEKKVLLGKRTNKPAKGFWFVPGGRIFKNEKIDDAIRRISEKEIHKELFRDDLEFYGIFEHFYPDSFVSDSIQTHYVVLAYKVKLASVPPSLPMAEHEEYRLLSRNEILENELVHEYTKQYFYSKGVI